MATSQVTNTSDLTPTPSSLPRTDKKGDLGQDAFLKLMVAQLQHQDPMAPTDSAAMMTQMAQITSVEQLAQIAEGFSAMENNQDFSSAVALLGRTVTYEKADGSQATGVVSSVKPSSQGAQLFVGEDKLRQGDIVKIT
jgi:flagellar basal-body rod modification protein FlgD